MEKAPPKLDYAGSPHIRLMPERRWLALAVVGVLVVLLVAFYILPVPGLVEILIVSTVFLALAGIVILTVLIFVLGKWDERISRINSRPGFPIDIPPNNPLENRP